MDTLFPASYESSLEDLHALINNTGSEPAMEGFLGKLFNTAGHRASNAADRLEDGLLDSNTVARYRKNLRPVKSALKEMHFSKYNKKVMGVPHGFTGDLLSYTINLGIELERYQIAVLSVLTKYLGVLDKSISTENMDEVINHGQMGILGKHKQAIQSLFDENIGSTNVSMIRMERVISSKADLEELMVVNSKPSINTESIFAVSKLADDLSGRMTLAHDTLKRMDNKDRVTMKDFGNLSYEMATHVDFYASSVQAYKIALSTGLTLQQTVVDDFS